MSRRAAAEADRDVAALLAGLAFIEIRTLATAGEDVAHIRFLADLCHNLPGVARPARWRPSRAGARPTRRERAMTDRPMSWTWNTAGPDGQAWMLRRIGEHGLAWTPPPPLPQAQPGPPSLTLRQWAAVLAGRWPVRAPAGRRPLPPEAHVLKALDTDQICALYEEAGRLRLGLGKGGPWLRDNLDPDGVHYLVPDPAGYYWPGTGVGRDDTIDWWQCTALLRMSDGDQVTSSVSVLPETFAALPSTVPRWRQRRLVQVARATERDAGLWSRSRDGDG